jgi:hypothetical protein
MANALAYQHDLHLQRVAVGSAEIEDDESRGFNCEAARLTERLTSTALLNTNRRCVVYERWWL